MSSISTKLRLGLLTVIGFFLLQAAFFIYNESAIQNNLDVTIKNNTAIASQLSSLAVTVQQMRRFEKEYFIYVGNIEKRTIYQSEWLASLDKANALLITLKKNERLTLSAPELQKVEAWLQALDFYKTEAQKIINLANTQNSQANLTAKAPPTPLTATEANDLIGAGKTRLSTVLIAGVAELEAAKTKQTLGLAGAVDAGFNQLTLYFVALTALGILIVLVLMITLPSAITKPIDALSDSIDKLSKGKANEAFEDIKTQEFAKISKSLERLRLSQYMLMERFKA
jgi:methyl-accepting chemotaxis protein